MIQQKLNDCQSKSTGKAYLDISLATSNFLWKIIFLSFYMFLGLCTCEYRLLHNPLTQNVWLQILGSLIKRLCTGNLLFPYNNQTISTQWLLTFLDFFVCHKVIYLSDLKQGLKLDEINVELNGLCRICRIRQKYLSCIVEDLLSSLNIYL